MKKTKKRNWAAVRLDYEQGDDGWSHCGEWHIAHISDPDVVSKGTGMESLVSRIVSSKPGHWVMVNLDIDGRLMIGHLMHDGWKVSADGSPQEGEFSPLISEDGKIIRIRIRTDKGLQDIHDMKRLVPVSLASLRDMVTDGVRDWRISDDVCVAARMLGELNGEDLTRITLSSNAYNDLLNMLGRHRFSQLFPKLDAKQNALAADALTGGFVYLKPGCAGKRLGEGISVDANSLYPSVAMVNRLPVGKPKHFEGEPPEDGMLKIYTATVDWDIKRGGLPILARRWRKYEDEDGHSPSPMTLTMTDVDWELFRENYDVTVTEWLGGDEYFSRKGVLNPYFDKWGAIKRESEGGRRLMSKFMVNTLIGKFGSHTVRMSRIPVLHDDGKVVYELQPPKRSRGIYTPLTAFVNAYARRELSHAIKANRARVTYSDTDSMHLTGLTPPKGIVLDPVAFGAWKVEKRYSQIVHLREKSYLWTDLETGATQCRVSGMPDNIARTMDYDSFAVGWKNWDEKTGKVTPGLERWLPLVNGEHVRRIAGKYRIGG